MANSAMPRGSSQGPGDNLQKPVCGGGWLRRVGGGVADAVVSPPGAAVLLAVGLFVWSVMGLSDVSYFGHSSPEAREFAMQHLLHKVLMDQLKILSLYVAVALFGGLFAWGLLAARDWVGRRKARPPRWWRLVRGLLVAGALHGFFFLRAAVETPQLYEQSLYGQGGWRRVLQVNLTHHAGLMVLQLGFFLLVVGFVFSPLARSRVRKGWTQSWRRPRLPKGGRRRAAVVSWAVAPVAVLLVLLAVVGWFLAPPRSSPQNKGPNVVILAVDGLRADHVYRGSEDKAPRLAEFRRGATVFTRAYTSLARTFPSWMSLLTGRFPHSHGVRHMFPTPEELARVGPVLPAHLKRAGYETAVVSDYAGEIFGRVELGFDHIDVPAFDFYQIVRQQSLRVHTPLLPYLTTSFGRRMFPVVDGFPDAADPFDMARRVKGSLQKLSRHKKFFLTAFFSTTHFPYAAPYPYYRLFTKAGYDGPFKYGKTRIPGEKKPTKADIRQVRGLYSGAVSATDAAFGEVLDELRRLGIADRTIVVVVSDHGETLYESNLGMGHGDHLRGESALQIPLMIRVPGVSKGREVDAVVRDVDLAPTLSALLGHPLSRVDGQDLRPLIEGKKKDLGLSAYSETGVWFTLAGEGWTPEDRLYYPEVLGGLMEIDADKGYTIKLKAAYRDLVIAAKHRCLIRGRWKLIYRPLREGVSLQLYDVKKDPLNLNDLAEKRKELVARLWKSLRRWLLQDPQNVARGRYVLPRVEASPTQIGEGSNSEDGDGDDEGEQGADTGPGDAGRKPPRQVEGRTGA